MTIRSGRSIAKERASMGPDRMKVSRVFPASLFASAAMATGRAGSREEELGVAATTGTACAPSHSAAQAGAKFLRRAKHIVSNLDPRTPSLDRYPRLVKELVAENARQAEALQSGHSRTTSCQRPVSVCNDPDPVRHPRIRRRSRQARPSAARLA